MEPPSLSPGMPGTGPASQPPVAGNPSLTPGSGPRGQLRPPALPVRARADLRIVAATMTGGVIFDIAARAGAATIAGTWWIIVAAGALLFSRRAQGHTSQLSLIAAMAFGLILTVRSSPWVTLPVAASVVALLLIGSSAGADGSGSATSFARMANRAEVAIGHFGAAPGMLRITGAPGQTARRAAAGGRGALLAIPVVLVIGWLLARADPVFRSWIDLPDAGLHIVLILLGSWAVLGLCRIASAQQPAMTLPAGPTLGTIEAVVVVSGLAAVYAAFVAAQLEALSGAGHRILVTRGLTYAQYARSGFFELLACAAITLLILLGVRACAKQGHPVLTAVYGLTIVLTLGVVVTAIRRLQLYEAAFGLTMLRLACLVAASWIGIVFLLLAATLARRGLPPRFFPAAMIISGLAAVAIWGLANPAAVVARTNLSRAHDGRVFDVGQAAGLGPDAVPALVQYLPELSSSQSGQLRHELCGVRGGKDTGVSFNLDRYRAAHSLAHLCG